MRERPNVNCIVDLHVGRSFTDESHKLSHACKLWVTLIGVGTSYSQTPMRRQDHAVARRSACA